MLPSNPDNVPCPAPKTGATVPGAGTLKRVLLEKDRAFDDLEQRFLKLKADYDELKSGLGAKVNVSNRAVQAAVSLETRLKVTKAGLNRTRDLAESLMVQLTSKDEELARVTESNASLEQELANANEVISAYRVSRRVVTAVACSHENSLHACSFSQPPSSSRERTAPGFTLAVRTRETTRVSDVRRLAVALTPHHHKQTVIEFDLDTASSEIGYEFRRVVNAKLPGYLAASLEFSPEVAPTVFKRLLLVMYPGAE